MQSMKLRLACVLAIAVALAALTVAIGTFRQSRNLQAELTATTRELQQTRSDLERAKREAGLSYPFHESFLRYFGTRDAADRAIARSGPLAQPTAESKLVRDAMDRAIARGGTEPDVLVRDVARSLKIEQIK
jgi:hypothetical protein